MNYTPYGFGYCTAHFKVTWFRAARGLVEPAKRLELAWLQKVFGTNGLPYHLLTYVCIYIYIQYAHMFIYIYIVCIYIYTYINIQSNYIYICNGLIQYVGGQLYIYKSWLYLYIVLYCPYGLEHFLRRPWLLSRSSAVWGDATHHKQRFRLGFKTKQQLHTQNGS